LSQTDGKLYQLAGDIVANNNAKAAPHITHTVTITGDVLEKSGILILTSIELPVLTDCVHSCVFAGRRGSSAIF
jgi:hypothetical protein